MSTIKLFWWAPYRDLRLAVPEIRSNPMAWLRLSKGIGRIAKNFGDEYSPLIVNAATGRRVIWSPPEKAGVIAVGSIMDLYASRGAGAVVWGSGLRGPLNEAEAESFRDKFGSVLGVRGPRTKLEMKVHQDTPMGDPGVLAPLLVGSKKFPSRRKTVLIPHFRTWASKYGRDLLTEARKSGIDILQPNLGPVEMAERIRDADLVLTSSLHGFIFAHAFGVPAQLVHLGESSDSEPEFKYHDYIESIDGTFDMRSMHEILNFDNRAQMFDRSSSHADNYKSRVDNLAVGLLKAASEI